MEGGYRLFVVVHLEVHLAQGCIGAVAQWIDLEGFLAERLGTGRISLPMEHGCSLVHYWEDVDGSRPVYW
jgi:hypothetical protein